MPHPEIGQVILRYIKGPMHLSTNPSELFYISCSEIALRCNKVLPWKVAQTAGWSNRIKRTRLDWTCPWREGQEWAKVQGSNSGWRKQNSVLLFHKVDNTTEDGFVSLGNAQFYMEKFQGRKEKGAGLNCACVPALPNIFLTFTINWGFGVRGRERILFSPMQSCLVQLFSSFLVWGNCKSLLVFLTKASAFLGISGKKKRGTIAHL